MKNLIILFMIMFSVGCSFNKETEQSKIKYLELEKSIDPQISKQIFKSQEYLEVRNLAKTEQDKVAVKNMTILSIIELDKFSAKDLTKEEAFENEKKSSTLLKCFSLLYGLEGIELRSKVNKVINQSVKRHLQSLKNSKHFAFKLISSPEISKEDCEKSYR